MACRRKDSFLWGRAERTPLRSSRPQQGDPGDDPQTPEPRRVAVEPPVSTEPGEQKKNNLRKRIFLCGKKKFNMDPKKGICYLVENNFLEWRAESVADFIYKEDGLNKTAIGTFLGEREEMHVAVLKAFVNLHQFSRLNLVQALRQFLWSFRLPGEAQKIDRMMEAFAARYCQCNPGVFQSTDTCYILSFSIIMLNTSLHNPSVKDKPDRRRFFTMNRGIDRGDDLSVELLTKLYDSISKEPFKIPEDDGNDLTLTFFNPDREGWLLKRGGRVKTWKRRWFILTDGCLYYFRYTSDKNPMGIIPLENLSVRPIKDPSKQYCLELWSCGGQTVKACKVGAGGPEEGKHHSYRLSTGSRAEQDGWVASIRSSISKDPFYDLVTSRRRRVTSSINNNSNNINNNSNNINNSSSSRSTTHGPEPHS